MRITIVSIFFDVGGEIFLFNEVRRDMTGERPVPDKADKFPARQMSSPIAISIHKVRCGVLPGEEFRLKLNPPYCRTNVHRLISKRRCMCLIYRVYSCHVVTFSGCTAAATTIVSVFRHRYASFFFFTARSYTEVTR